MRPITTTLAAAAAALAVVGPAAATMRPELGARLSGMGEHGIVNLQSHAASGRLCWTFELGGTRATGASIRDAHGMLVARLGTAFRAHACGAVAARALAAIDARPGAYRVWVDTSGHPGELRGTLFAGMARM